MRIKFTGYYNIPPEDVPDERGSVDAWLVSHIGDVIKMSPEIEDIYQGLELSWEVDVNGELDT